MKSYLITGATGFIGSQMIEEMIKENGDETLQIILPVRDQDKARKKLRFYLKNKKINFIFIECEIKDILKGNFLEGFQVDYIIHCAAPTSSKYMISNPVETADTIILGTRNLLELARKMSIKSMVYLSSMEVYGQVADNGKLRTEDELGSIDLNKARSCYSMGKRTAEHYCHIYYQQYGVPVKVARLSQVFGTGVRLDDTRVFMQFAKCAVENKDIVLNTKGNSIGNYCATEDAVSAVFKILNSGKDGETYNVVNEENTMQIIEMAHIVASEIADRKINIVIEIEDESKTGYAPDTGLRISGEKLRNLGWKPRKNIIQMYSDVVYAIKEKM